MVMDMSLGSCRICIEVKLHSDDLVLMALVGKRGLEKGTFSKIPPIKFWMEEELLKKTKIYVQCLDMEQSK